MKILKITGIIIIVIFVIIAGIVTYVKTSLPNIELKDIKVEINQKNVERGEYLANHVMMCMDCHSTRDWSKFSGPLVHGTLGKGGEIFDEDIGFPGQFVSPNITPYNLKDWSDAEIFRAITAGVKKDGSPIFPVMPYHSYGKIAKEDIEAVIAYLRTLESIESNPPESKANFPMNIIMHLIPQKPTFSEIPDKNNSIEYGEYLVNASACADCHTPLEKGQPVEEMRLAGGREFKLENSLIRASNLTPDNKTGIGKWSKEAFINRFQAYSPETYTPPKVNKNGFQSIMPWTMYADMDSTDLAAIFDYLNSLKPIKNKVIKFEANN